MTIEDLSARLEKVERANRVLRVAVGGLALLAVAVATLGQAAGPPKAVQAGRFEVVDDSGTVWGAFRIATSGRGATFEAFHEGGLVGASLTTQADGGSFLNLRDCMDGTMANLAANEKTTGLVLARQGPSARQAPKEFARFGMSEDGRPMLRIRDRENWERADEARADRFLVTLGADGSPLIQVQRPFGRMSSAGAMFEFVDKDGKVIERLPK